MNKTAIIVSGGTIDQDFALKQVEQLKAEIIIGVDRGLEFLYQNQIMPTHIVGDFDSVEPEIVEYYRNETKVPIRQFDPVKDASDTEIAIRLAIELGVNRLWLLGATGTRLDHVLANIQTLKVAHDAGVKAYILDAHNRISLIAKECTLRKEEQYGEYFSVFPLGGEVPCFTIKGAKYPLENHTLMPYDSLCVSNQIKEKEVEITFPEGIVVLMETRECRKITKN